MDISYVYGNEVTSIFVTRRIWSGGAGRYHAGVRGRNADGEFVNDDLAPGPSAEEAFVDMFTACGSGVESRNDGCRAII